MKEKDLRIILQEGEGYKIEFKENLSRAIVEDIVAFANASGGRIFLGISDEGKIKGIKITNKLKSQIQDSARNCDPKIEVFLERYNDILIIEVKEGDNKPYKCSFGFYLRQGANSQKLTRDEIIQFFIAEGKIRFDEQINTNFVYPDDFDQAKLDEYVEAAGISKTHKPEDILINLGVAQKQRGKLLFNNAGILFFAKDPVNFFRSAYVNVAVFEGKEKINVIDKKDFRSGLLQNLNRSRVYLKEHLNVRFEYGEDWKRKNIYELPLEALREAVVNALMHRDYFFKGANINIHIFDDRVEIANPGGIPKPLTKKDLGKRSMRRNEIIADLFSRLDFVEKLGTGINKIRRWMKEQGLKMPKIESDGFFTMTFNRGAPEKAPKVHLKIAPKKRRAVILQRIKKREAFSYDTLAKEFGVNRTTIMRDIKELKAEKKIKFVGSKRTGHYELIE